MTNDLYRHFDKDGMLLYVGISLNSIVRLSQHKLVSSWYHEIVNVTIEKFESRESVIIAEKKAIKEEYPKHNIIHNKDTDKLENDIFTRPEDSRLYLLDNILQVKPTYLIWQLNEILNIGEKTIKEYIKNGTIGSVLIKRTYYSQYDKYIEKRIVTGWQLLDFIEYMQNGGLDE